MRYSIVILCAFVLLTSCSPSSYKKASGKYSTKGKDYSYDLILRPDTTFTLSELHIEWPIQCEGRWTIIDKTTLLLKCREEETILSQIESGYMSQRTRTVVLLSRKRIKIDSVILNKK